MVSGLASPAALLGFITHIVRILRVDTMMATVHGDAKGAIDAFYPLRRPAPTPPLEPATPCPSTCGAGTLSSFVETHADLRENLGAVTQLLLGRDFASGLVTEYLGNMCGTLGASHSTSDDDPNHQDLRPC